MFRDYKHNWDSLAVYGKINYEVTFIDFCIDIFVMMSSDLSETLSSAHAKSHYITRLILSQGGACACVIYISITPPCGKISLVNIANTSNTSNFPVTGIPFI